MDESQPKTSHLLTVMLEDYFHVAAFDRVIGVRQWECFETRFERNTRKVLDWLDTFDIRATFFVLGWIADRQPELVREVARRGHEIASRGYDPRLGRILTPAGFREDLIRARESLERASGRAVVGHRAAQRWREPKEWALDILAEEGFAYDSSLAPIFRFDPTGRIHRYPYQHDHAGRTIWEIPIPTFNLFGLLVPIGGGNAFRQLPHAAVKRAVARWDRTQRAPFTMYCHVWEFDPDQPRINASRLARIRHYRNLDRLPGILEEYFQAYRFGGIADYLGIERPPVDRPQPFQEPPPVIETDAGDRIDVDLVVPCYNEELTLPYLANTLRGLLAELGGTYRVSCIFVDDCSTDATWETLNRLFGAWPRCRFVHHDRNRGVAAAILTGIGEGTSEIVCSMDCDCTYDPHELRRMIPLLIPGVDLVTASPYHPNGEVRNVPGWRLGLSKAASFLYRRVLRQKLHTYTSCFRVYRRSAVASLTLREGGFLGIAELVGKLDLAGARIVEYPATLDVRLFGQSKMKIVKTIASHLRLLSQLVVARTRQVTQGLVKTAFPREKTVVSGSTAAPPRPKEHP